MHKDSISSYKTMKIRANPLKPDSLEISIDFAFSRHRDTFVEAELDYKRWLRLHYGLIIDSFYFLIVFYKRSGLGDWLL